MKPRERLSPLAARLLLIAGLLCLWEIVGRLGSDLFVSPFSAVVTSGTGIFTDPAVLSALVTTAWELCIAFAVSLVVGLLLGLFVAGSGFTYQTFYPIVLLVYAIPQITILPLFSQVRRKRVPRRACSLCCSCGAAPASRPGRASCR